jgi:hypothetical protein
MPQGTQLMNWTPSYRRVLLAAVLAVVLGVAGTASRAATAQASATQFSAIMDDNLLVYGSDGDRISALNVMNLMGVQVVRVTMSWNFMAASATRTIAQRRRFRGDIPSRYSPVLWDRFDKLIRAAKLRNIRVLLCVTGPGPPAFNTPTKDVFNRPTFKPSAFQYYRFVRAVGLRYSGHYHDENYGRAVLPKVDFFSIWNEPNQQAGITPQSEFNRTVHRVIPTAPIIYRELYYAAQNALRATGHAGDDILMGELAPLGSNLRGARIHLYPKEFLREMFCIAPNGQPYRGLDAVARRCSELVRGGAFLATGFAHHPYSQKLPPTQRDIHVNAINMANIGDLPVLLDELAAKTHKIEPNLPVMLTEDGWQTVPDPIDGIALSSQSANNNVLEHLAYDNPRIAGTTQFLLRDVTPRFQYRRTNPRLYWSTWQSGVLFSNNRPKPAFSAYLMPFDIGAVPATQQGAQVRIWGQVRFLRAGDGVQVQFQFKPLGSDQFLDYSTPVAVAGPHPFYDNTITSPGPGTWRAFATGRGGTIYSREVPVQ